MKNMTLFAGDKIRMHANDITAGGLGIAVDPFFMLPLEASDEELEKAIRQCLEASRTNVPERPWQKSETTVYYQKLGVRSHKDLGRGVDLRLEAGCYLITPVDKSGRFGEPIETGEEAWLGVIRECLGVVATQAG